MKLRTAAKILATIDGPTRRHEILYRPAVVREALSLLSRHPTRVERIICRPQPEIHWGVRYDVVPALVHERFGDGACWGTVEPLSTRPDHYVVMGDSSWERPDAIWDVLDEQILPAIEEQYGRYDFECDLCRCTGWGQGHDDCECHGERGWPRLDDDCGCGWAFPCYLAATEKHYRFAKWSRACVLRVPRRPSWQSFWLI